VFADGTIHWIKGEIGDGGIVIEIPEPLLTRLQLRGPLLHPRLQLIPCLDQGAVGPLAYPQDKPHQHKGEQHSDDKYSQHHTPSPLECGQGIRHIDLGRETDIQLLTPEPGPHYRRPEITWITIEIHPGLTGCCQPCHVGQRPALRVGRQLATLRQVDTGIADAQREYGRRALGFHTEQLQLGAEPTLTDQPAPGIEGIGFPGQAYPALAGDAGKIGQRVDVKGQCGDYSAPVVPYRGEEKGNRIAADLQRRYKDRFSLQRLGQQIGIMLRYRGELPKSIIEVGCNDPGITVDEIEAGAAQSFLVPGKQTLQ